MLSAEMGRLGLEQTVGNSIRFSSLKSRTSKLTNEHCTGAFLLCIVVNDRLICSPFRFNFLISSSVQNEVFDPLSRNAYVSTILDCPFALTRTGTIASPVTEDTEMLDFVDILMKPLLAAFDLAVVADPMLVSADGVEFSSLRLLIDDPSSG